MQEEVSATNKIRQTSNGHLDQTKKLRLLFIKKRKKEKKRELRLF